MDFVSSTATFIREGGPFMLLIFGVAVLIVGIAAERTLVILRASTVDGNKLVERVATGLRRGQANEARSLVAKGRNPMLAVTRALLDRPLAGLDRAAAEQDLTDAYGASSSVAMAPMHHRLGYLAMLANVATLLGLLGTIFGLTQAFSAVGQADPAQRSAFLAAGISQALNTTAFGLIIAIPTMALHAFLLAQVDGLADRLEAAAQRLIQTLSQGGASSSTQPQIQEVRRASVAVR